MNAMTNSLNTVSHMTMMNAAPKLKLSHASPTPPRQRVQIHGAANPLRQSMIGGVSSTAKLTRNGEITPLRAMAAESMTRSEGMSRPSLLAAGRGSPGVLAVLTG